LKGRVIRLLLLFSLAFSATLCLPAQAGSSKPGAALTREDKWRQDLQFLQRELPIRHKNLFFQMKREDFERSLAELNQALPSLRDDQIVVRLMRIIAAVGDGHTSLGWQSEAMGFHEFPLGLYWFNEGLYVVNASPQYREALGKRVVRIGDTPIKEAYDKVGELISHDNEFGLRVMSPSYLVVPEVLQALGILPDRDKGRFVVEDESGNPSTLEVAPVRLGEKVERMNAAKGSVPLYRTPKDDLYWYEYLADSRTLYFHYRTCMEMKELSFSQFSRKLLAFADRHPVQRFVIDLRFNPGGNEHILQSFIQDLKSRPFNRKGGLFVVIGWRTASSAMDNAISLRENTEAILVGQPTSGKPNSYGEVKKMTLPNSGLTVRYSTKYWHKVKGDPLALEPDIGVEVSFRDYLAGRDPAMEAIFSYK
jgi:hypothetical protein